MFKSRASASVSRKYQDYKNFIPKLINSFMKKIFFSMALVAAMCMTSCGGSSTEASKDAQADSIAAAEEALANEAAASKAAFEQQLGEAAQQVEGLKDEAEAKNFLTKAQDYVQQLVKDGKAQEAKEYLAKIGPAITAKYPALKDVVEGADKLVDAAIATGNGAVEGVKDAAENAVEDAKDAAAGAVDAAKEKAGEAVDAAKAEAAKAADKAGEAAGKAVDAAKEKANDAANKAAEAAKGLIPGKK